MKPIQQVVLELIANKPYTGTELYRHFHNGDNGITSNWQGKSDQSKQQAWINRFVKPLIRSRKIKRVDNQYKIIEQVDVKIVVDNSGSEIAVGNQGSDPLIGCSTDLLKIY